jgi:hypothetical protein
MTMPTSSPVFDHAPARRRIPQASPSRAGGTENSIEARQLTSITGMMPLLGLLPLWRDRGGGNCIRKASVPRCLSPTRQGLPCYVAGCCASPRASDGRTTTTRLSLSVALCLSRLEISRLRASAVQGSSDTVRAGFGPMSEFSLQEDSLVGMPTGVQLSRRTLGEDPKRVA